jgi:hypothetical protein
VCISRNTDQSYSEAAYQAQHSIAVRGICSGAKRSATISSEDERGQHFEGWPREDYSLEAERETTKIICRRVINLR